MENRIFKIIKTLIYFFYKLNQSFFTFDVYAHKYHKFQVFCMTEIL